MLTISESGKGYESCLYNFCIFISLKLFLSKTILIEKSNKKENQHIQNCPNT